MKIELYPTKCNICGSKVEYTEIAKVYGKRNLRYESSGYCYHCTNPKCKAIVGTHKARPLEAMGLLADKEMSQMRQKSHDLFDKLWKTREERTEMYHKLADKLGIPFEDCHFAYFTKEQLKQVYSILVELWREKFDI